MFPIATKNTALHYQHHITLQKPISQYTSTELNLILLRDV